MSIMEIREFSKRRIIEELIWEWGGQYFQWSVKMEREEDEATSQEIKFTKKEGGPRVRWIKKREI